MRKHIFAAFVAALLLVGSTAFAQSRAGVGAVWTSATAVNTTLVIPQTGTSIPEAYQSAEVSYTPLPAGSITGGTLTFEHTDDGVNWYPIAVGRLDSLAIDTTFNLNGAASQSWRVGLGGVASFRVRLSVVIVGAGSAHLHIAMLTASSGPQAIGGTVNLSTTDPCQAPNATKQFIAVTATGQLVALSGTTSVYLCSFYATLGGTSPTIQFKAGTGSACGTGTVTLSGAFAPAPNGTEFFLGHGGTVMASGAGNALCIALGGTSPTIAGVMSYVQQ